MSVKTSPKRPKPSVSFSLSGLPIELTCSANIPLRRLSTIEHTANPLNLIELLDDHLDGHAAAGKANHRNGYSKKTVLTENAKLDLRIPRDREGTFDPQLIARYQRRFPGFAEKIVSMYARGVTTSLHYCARRQSGKAVPCGTGCASA